jgi:hypothetical protein
MVSTCGARFAFETNHSAIPGLAVLTAAAQLSEIDRNPKARAKGEALGIPQAFTHLAVISAAFNPDRMLTS